MKKRTKAKDKLETVVKAFKKANRELELERNGHWIAVDRPHKNKKKYDRRAQKRELRSVTL